MSGKEAWGPEDEDYLREHYPTTANRKLAMEMGRTVNSIQIKANRLSLVKEIDDVGEFTNAFEDMSPDETRKLTKIDLLANSWSVLKMLRRELDNPHLKGRLRIQLMVAMSNHIVTINNIMKGFEEELGDSEDLELALARLGQTPTN